MEQKNSEQKTAQILYITIILALLIMAVTVGLVTAANKAKAPSVTEVTTTVTTPQKRPVVTTKPPVSTTESVTTAKTTEITTTKAPEVTTSLTTKLKPTVAEPAEPPLPTFSMPTMGNISAEFSIDTLVFSNTMEDYRTHNGIDVCAPVGQAVCAAADGVVKEVYEHPMMGYTVVISHDGYAESVYQNLYEEATVKVGDIVKSGDVIGAIGESAIIEIAEEPHLHFEMCIAGERVNPLDFIDAGKATIAYEE